MESREILGRLEQSGFTLLRIHGSHHVFGHTDGRRVVVPHPRKDFPVGTLRNISRQAGWPWPPK
ncbi:MAG: type II toxin-antitoxin system HicA family toxin [Desulfovibrio sp.]|nr:type II toxin-antitoxin system HicA family toxin [Desulfovibrio sp.]MBI4960256.1 type II toxin-antitoxin system HicA family toxin [Desulfovibrio sp.]